MCACALALIWWRNRKRRKETGQIVEEEKPFSDFYAGCVHQKYVIHERILTATELKSIVLQNDALFFVHGNSCEYVSRTSD